MTNPLPERIWAKTPIGKRTSGYRQDEPMLPNKPENICTEHVRADLATKDAEIARLRDAINSCRLAFAGYIDRRSAIDKLDALEDTP